MAKKIPTLSPDIISSACSDISKIVEAKHLGQKNVNHEVSSEGALLIGRRLEQEIAGYPISNLNSLLSPIACHLKQHFSPSLGPTYLKRCIKLARIIPEDMPFRPELDLDHYQSLARIANKDLRLDLMNAAADNHWDASRIDRHARYRSPQDVLDAWERRALESNQEVWRFARAYTDACGIISLDKLIELYNSYAPNPVSRFEVNETIWQIRNESGRIDNPCIISKDGMLYLIAPELDDAVDEAPYYYDDYGCSYRKYERHSEYTDEMRTLRERHVGTRMAAIFAGHERLPIKKLRYEEVINGSIKNIRSAEHLKQYVLKDPELKAAELHAREDEFDFIMTKLLRSVGLNGMPTAQQITEDAAFLLIVVRPEFYERKKTAEVSKLLSIIYEDAPLWEFNGRSNAELRSEEAAKRTMSISHRAPQP